MRIFGTGFCRVFLPASLLAGCSGSTCVNAVVSGNPSPDGAAIAFVFHRRCGTPAVVSTQVSLIPLHVALHDESGNVLRVDGEQPVHVHWQTPVRLVVSGFEKPTFEPAGAIDGVTIEFR